MSGARRIGDDLTMFTLRLLQHAADEMTAEFWDKRAVDFENAVSRPTDYPGKRSAEDREKADETNRLTALCCRRHAALLRERWDRGELSPELLAVVDEVIAGSS